LKKTYNGKWIIESDNFFGVSTGYDPCAEHECGIKSLQSSAGIIRLTDIKPKKSWFGLKKTEPIFGLERTTIKNITKIVHGFAEMEDGSGYHIFGYNTKGRIPMNFKKDFEAHWDDERFIIASKDKEKINELAKAAYSQDLAFTTGGNVLEGYSGIRLVIKSKTPQYIIDECKKDDAVQYELKKLDKKIGVQSKLRKAGCGFYTCTPRWKDYDKKEIHWWLNPRDQKNNDYGFFTYDELIEWTKGKGSIILNKDDKETIF